MGQRLLVTSRQAETDDGDVSCCALVLLTAWIHVQGLLRELDGCDTSMALA